MEAAAEVEVAAYVEAGPSEDAAMKLAMKAVWKSVEVQLAGGEGGAPEAHAVEQGLVLKVLLQRGKRFQVHLPRVQAARPICDSPPFAQNPHPRRGMMRRICVPAAPTS